MTDLEYYERLANEMDDPPRGVRDAMLEMVAEIRRLRVALGEACDEIDEVSQESLDYSGWEKVVTWRNLAGQPEAAAELGERLAARRRK